MNKRISLLLGVVAIGFNVKSQEVATTIYLANKKVEKIDQRLRKSSKINSKAFGQEFLVNKNGKRSSFEQLTFLKDQNDPLAWKKYKGTYYYLKYDQANLKEVDRLVFTDGGKL